MIIFQGWVGKKYIFLCEPPSSPPTTLSFLTKTPLKAFLYEGDKTRFWQKVFEIIVLFAFMRFMSLCGCCALAGGRIMLRK